MILRCREATTPETHAQRLLRWAKAEVLPSIHQNGGYLAGQEEMNPEQLMAQAVLVAHKVIAAKQARIEALEPVAAVDQEIFNLGRREGCPLPFGRPSGAS